MGRVNTPILSESEQQALENLYKTSDNHSLRKRCQTILLKAAKRDSKEVGTIVGMSHISVNSWLKRYKSEGISGLYIKAGRGRKARIDKALDQDFIIESVKKHRQRVQLAKAEWQASRDKKVSSASFKRFLKKLADDINV
jgi:transposase